jgi:cytoskeletal protein RodZ
MGIGINIAEAPESFGQFLKRERESRDMSLEEIASYTRIKMRALEAIERDDFAALPPLAFVRAFIRCYADYLGLNVADVMLRFDAFIQARYPDLTGEVTLIQKKRPPKQKYLPLILGVAAILTVFVFYWLHGGGPDTIKKNGDKSGDVAINDPKDGGKNGADAGSKTGANLGAHDHNAKTPPVTPDAGAHPAGGTTTGAPKVPDPGKQAPHGEFNPTVWRDQGKEPLGPPRKLMAEAPPATDAVVESSGPHRVEITLKDKCFTQYTADDGPRTTVMLDPGPPSVLLAEHKIKIALSNPSAVVEVKHNGEPVEFKPTCYPWSVNFPPGPNDNPCTKKTP